MKIINSKFIIHNSTLLLFLSLLFFTTCEQGTSPPSNNKITLTFEDASCTEAWLNLQLNKSLALPTDIELKLNDSTIIITNINSNDTTLFIENLLPNQIYNFKATINQQPATSNQQPATSNKVAVTTMDTTSHNFTWQYFTVGNYGSRITDVAIINESNIWAVGDIVVLGETEHYNAVHWNGDIWTLKKIYWDNKLVPLTTVFAFGKKDIFFGYKDLLHYTKNGFEKIDVPNSIFSGNQKSLWGSSNKDIYIGGYGSLAHYDGTKWTKIDITENFVNHIWGVEDLNTGKYDINIVISRGYKENGKIFRIINNKLEELSLIGLPQGLGTIWYSNIYKKYIISRDSGELFVKTIGKANNNWENISNSTSPILGVAIKGNSLNDIFVSGAGNHGAIAHFNGVNWKSNYDESPFLALNKLLDIKDNIVVIASFDLPETRLIIGKR